MMQTYHGAKKNTYPRMDADGTDLVAGVVTLHFVSGFQKGVLNSLFILKKRGGQMKAIRFHEFGGPDVLKYEDVPDPKPRKDQVLVRVKACALNHLDLFIRKGLPGVKLPHINGSDVSGDIAEVG
jgi:hypothetical protein